MHSYSNAANSRHDECGCCVMLQMRLLCHAVMCRYVTPRPPVCGGKATLLYNSKAGPLAWIEDKRTKAQKDKSECNHTCFDSSLRSLAPMKRQQAVYHSVFLTSVLSCTVVLILLWPQRCSLCSVLSSDQVLPC